LSGGTWETKLVGVASRERKKTKHRYYEEEVKRHSLRRATITNTRRAQRKREMKIGFLGSKSSGDLTRRKRRKGEFFEKSCGPEKTENHKKAEAKSANEGPVA